MAEAHNHAFTFIINHCILDRPPPIKTVAIHQQPYSYPDPRQIKGNVAFDLRLLELRKSEVETVRSEEARKRLLASRSKSAIPLATSWSPRQPNTWSHASTFARSGSHRASITATPADRRPSTMSPPSRKLSLPATIQYTYNDTKYARESPTVDAKSDSLSSGWNTSSSKKCITADATIAKRRPRSACSTRQKESISIAASYSFTDLLAVQKKRNSADKLTPVISEDEEILADSPQNKSCPQDGISSIEDVTLASESEKSTAPDGLLLAQEVSQGGKHSSRECQASVTFIPSQEVEPHSSNVRGDAESRELCSCLCHITVDPHLDEKTQNCSHKGDDIRAGRTTTKKEVVDCKDSCSPLPSVSQDEITLKQDQRSSDRVDELSSCDGSSKRVDLGEREARHTRHGKRKAAAKKIGSGGRSKSVTRLEPATGQQSMQSSVSTASLRSTRSSKERKRSEKKQKHASKLRK